MHPEMIYLSYFTSVPLVDHHPFLKQFKMELRYEAEYICKGSLVSDQKDQ